MANFVVGKGKEFYVEHLRYLGSMDIDGLLDDHYHDDAVMVTFDGIRRGKKELKEYFVNTFEKMGKVLGLSTEYFAETEDVIIFKATITSEKRGEVKADDALYIKDGKISRHIAVTILPDYDYKQLGTAWEE